MKYQHQEDVYIRQFISELGPDGPSPAFHKTILQQLTTKATHAAYKPVISPLAWKIIGGAIAALFISVLVFIPAGNDVTPLFDQLPQLSIPSVGISLPKIHKPTVHLSPIVLQSLGAFLLMAFITMITSLKKWKEL